MPQRRFPRPWRFEPIPGGNRVIDANGLPLDSKMASPSSDKRLTHDEAEKLARLIVRLPELMELERERNKAKSRRRSKPPSRPVSLGDLARDGKLLEFECSACRPIPARLYRAIVARIAPAHAGAGIGRSPRLQRLWCQE
jgi:hypothetical protein